MLYVKRIMLLALLSVLTPGVSPSLSQDWSLDQNPQLAAYFESEVEQLERQNELTQYTDLAQWESAKPQLHAELLDMLGLSPMPVKSALQATITGRVEETDFTVEKVHFQSLPGLYVTGNFYLPKEVEGPLPTVLYVCGHAHVEKDDISLGNKTAYQHHGAWFARHGYACLIIDTLQLGEIEGIHHGTYRMNRWWWNSRGYTPAGVEAWNCIRALDYLETRPEIDAQRIGATGRSGGGVYSWWIAAIDERIQCVVPVAGITSMRNQVVGGCVEGHCDCMFMVNTHRWDFAKVAALVAPRPLLISNTDKDRIFPLEGVVDVHRQVRHIYRLHGAGDKLGLQITEGPHRDTQELHIHAFRWFNRFLKNDDSMIEKAATAFFEPEALKVFATLPEDEVNTRIDDAFVPPATIPAVESVLDNQEAWFARRLAQLRDRCFRAWPGEASGGPVERQGHIETLPSDRLGRHASDALQRTRIHFDSQPHVPLFMDLIHHQTQPLTSLADAILIVSDDPERVIHAALDEGLARSTALCVFSPRGLGPYPWIGNDAKQIQIRRRFQLIGSTLEAMRILDIRRALQGLRQACPKVGESIELRSDPSLEFHSLLATLFEPPITAQRLLVASADQDAVPSVLNLTRTVSPQELVALAVSRGDVEVASLSTPLTEFAQRLANDSRWRGKSIHEAAQ